MRNKKILAAPGLLLLVTILSQVAPAFALDASYYSKSSLIKEGTWRNGKESLMANGHRFDENKLTCATRLYPLNTKLLITNLKNNKKVIVIVTDRIGKRFATKRIDLSLAAFKSIATVNLGIVPIKAEVINGN